MTDVTSFITPSDEEPELASINFHESLRFFQEQLNLEGNHFPSSPNIHISKNGITSKFNNDLPRDETNDGTKSLSSCRISIPTVETILESVKVLRAIQKSQEQRWPMSNMLSSVGQKTQNSVPFEKTVTENDVIIVKKGGTIYSTENFVIDQECISNDSENTCFKTHGVANPLHSESGANIIESIVSKQEDDQSHCTDESKNEKCSSNFEFDSDKENGSDPTFDADPEDAEESSKLKDTEGINKLYYTIEFSNNNEFSHFWPSNSIHMDVDEINSSYDKNADHSQEHNCKNPSVLEHSSTYLKHSLDFKDNTTGDSETLPNKEVTTNDKIQKQCDDNLVSISEVDTGMIVYSSQNGDAPDPRGSTDHSERMMESSTVFDILADIKSSAAVTNENDDTLDKVALKSTPINQLVGKETQLSDGLKNGSAHEKLASHPETTLKLQLIDSSPPLSNQTSNGNIVSLTEQTQLECVRTPLSTDTSPESKCDKLTDVPNAVEQTVTVENKRPLSIEENYNQYEVFTETCKYMPNVQSTDLSDSNHSIVGSNLSGGGSNKNAKRDEEETHEMKDGYLKEANPAIKNEAHIELNTNGVVQKMDANDSLEVKKKFITSSWDLVSIVKLLYAIPEPQPRKVHSCEQMLQTKVLLLSKGSFSKYPEGVYEIKVDDNNLTVLQNSESILNFSLSYAEFSLDVGDILRIDNKMGRSLYMKSNSKRESLDWIETLQTLSDRQPECINLVHYPLKSYQNTLIIDLGSCSTRAGILMDQPTLPMFFFPSVCATDKTTGKNEFGMEALEPSKRQNSTISFPIRPSLQIIKHNIDVEKVTGIFKKIFKHLRVDPENYTVLVCLPRSLSISAQNSLVKVLLEEVNVKAVSLAHQAILTMYAHNVSTGVVVDIGDRMDIMPVIDGFVVESGVTRLPYGGQRLIHHMKHALAQKHISLSNEIDSFVVQYITEKLSYIALDYETEQHLATSHPEMVRKSINLQSFAKDETCLPFATLEEARFKVPEGLFNPDLWGLDFPGIHKLVQKAIQAAGVDTRKKIAENIYTSGGVTLIPGFVERLRKEVSKLNQPRITPKVFASEYRYHCTFIGACRFARMDVFPQVCISREEYRRNQHTSLKKFALCI